MKQELFNNLKNIQGWRSSRKFVVFSVDDYGNVRLNSKNARQRMDQAGMKVHSRFDAFDALETREDLEMLYETLFSVKDKNFNPAVFTPYALPCNINFEAMASNNFKTYSYEALPETYQKLSTLDSNSYSGAWTLWQEGMEKEFMKPQFHGREHFNLKVFNEKIQAKDHEVLTALKNRSYTSISGSGYPTIGVTAAFAFDQENDIKPFPEILRTGTDQFEKVFGFQSEGFTPPAQQFPAKLENTLLNYGIKWMDKPFYNNRHLGNSAYKKEFNSTKKASGNGLPVLVRNVVFEPTNGKIDHVGRAMKQIEAAFRWNKPANISSHRVNFCGHICEKNRAKGIKDLQILLKKIVTRWPDVEFVSAPALAKTIANEN